MPRYAANTTVSSSQSIKEIEITLKRYGASAFSYGWENQMAAIKFARDGVWYQVVVKLPDPMDDEFVYSEAGRTRSDEVRNKNWEKACRQRYRALALYIKATLEAVDCGIMSLAEAMMPFALLPDGETISQKITPCLDRLIETGAFPPMLMSGDK